MKSLKAKQLDPVSLQQTSKYIKDGLTVQLDPVALQQTSKYIKDGLTVVSNNTDIVPRDLNGNITVQSGSYMVIETNSFNIDKQPMLNLLDTQFNYFNFPVQVISNPIDVNFDVDFNIPPIDLSPPAPDAPTVPDAPPPPQQTFDRDGDIVPIGAVLANIQTLFDRDPAVLQTNKINDLFKNFNQALEKAGDELPSTRANWQFWFKQVSSGNRTQDLNIILDATIDNLVAGGSGII